MPTVVQFRRGTTAQNNVFTGAAGEISYDNQVNNLRVHDGTTAGGFPTVTYTGTQTISNKTFGSTILVSDSDSYDLGTNTERFRGAYVGTLYSKDGIIKATPSGVTVDSASAVVVASYAAGSLPTTIEYQIIANNPITSETMISKVAAAYNGGSIVASTEYGVVHTGDSDLGSLTVEHTSGDIRLLFTRRPANNIVVKTHQTIIT
tara:strand:- start:911 stop:1525 length:615 start_codon:yes stop_codon:yes gene_type:complete